MRLAAVTLLLVAALGATACAGDDEKAEPLTLEQRLLLESEVPGSEPDPMETRHEAGNLDQFVALDRFGYVLAAQIDRADLAETGFVSAIHDTRFYPETAGAEHTGDEPHVRMLVMQLGSDDGAKKALDQLREERSKPCPGECAAKITEFDADGPPDAKGTRVLVTAEELKATGQPGEPGDSYTIFFSDGPFVYEVEIFGKPGTVSEERIEEIAQKLHERVEGAPPPGD